MTAPHDDHHQHPDPQVGEEGERRPLVAAEEMHDAGQRGAQESVHEGPGELATVPAGESGQARPERWAGPAKKNHSG